MFESQESLKVNVAKSLLSERGIESVILDKKDSAYVVIGRSELHVPKEKAEEAINILNEEMKD